MKVLVVLDALNFGGAENLIATLARVGPRHDLELDVVSLAPATGDKATWLPVLQEAGLRPRFLGITRLAQPDAVFRLARAIRDSGCDLVHAHLEDAATLAPVAARLTGRPCVCTYHHVPGPLQGRDRIRERLSIAVASRCDRVIFVSEASRRGFADRYRAHRSWTVVHNGIDLTQFAVAPGPLPADLQIPPGAPVVSVVGHLRPGKGHDTAVAAWPAVLSGCPQARLVLVGDGPLEDDLRARSAAHGLCDRIVFAGRRTDVYRILAGSTVACLPTHREALPTALIEAAACGVPAVASGVSGVLEVVQDGVSGLLVAPDEPAQLAQAVLTLLTDEPRRAEMGRAARRIAEERFDADAWCERLSEIYTDAIDTDTISRRVLRRRNPRRRLR